MDNSQIAIIIDNVEVNNDINYTNFAVLAFLIYDTCMIFPALIICMLITF